MDNWLNHYELRDMEIKTESNQGQSAPLAGCRSLFKALMELSEKGVFVCQFKSNGATSIIQVKPNAIYLNGSDLFGCKIVVKPENNG